MNTSDQKPTMMIEIDITKIRIPEDRLRLVDPAHVDQLLHSFLEVGQLQAIEVSPPDLDGIYTLIVGAHRVTAGLKAEFPTMKAVVFEGNVDDVRLHEIDENLYRHELNALDQATFLAERRTIFERVHGRISAGQPSHKKNSAKMAELNFFEETSLKFGLPRRTIERAITRRRSIDEQVWLRLRSLQKSIKGAELDVLAAQPRDVQHQMIALLIAPDTKIKTVTAALRVINGTKPKPPQSLFDRFLVLFEEMGAEDKAKVRAYVAAKKAKG